MPADDSLNKRTKPVLIHVHKVRSRADRPIPLPDIGLAWGGIERNLGRDKGFCDDPAVFRRGGPYAALASAGRRRL